MYFDKEIDTRGLNCPLPILRAKKALADLISGQVLKVTATDPGSVRDFAAFSRQTGHLLLESGEVDKEFLIFLKKKEAVWRAVRAARPRALVAPPATKP